MFNSILENGVFTESEYIPPKTVEPLKAYRFLREAIMDNRVPTTKVVGFSLTDTNPSYRVTAAERNGLVLESFPTIATNFTDKIIRADIPEIVAFNVTQGRLTADVQFKMLSGTTFNMLYTNPEILSATRDLTLSICTRTSTGYRTMLENSKVIHNNSYFPISSYHSLSDFIRFLPFDGHIRYKFYHGADLDLLIESVAKLHAFAITGGLDEEVRGWLSSYEV